MRGLVAVADGLQELVHGHAGEHGRGHLHPGFLQGRVAGRRFDHAAINEAQPADCRRVSHGELQGHVAAPGVPGYYGPVQSRSPDEPQQVMGYSSEVVAFFGFGALAVTPLVQGHHGIVLGQDGGHQVPDTTG